MSLSTATVAACAHCTLPIPAGRGGEYCCTGCEIVAGALAIEDAQPVNPARTYRELDDPAFQRAEWEVARIIEAPVSILSDPAALKRAGLFLVEGRLVLARLLSVVPDGADRVVLKGKGKTLKDLKGRVGEDLDAAAAARIRATVLCHDIRSGVAAPSAASTSTVCWCCCRR